MRALEVGMLALIPWLPAGREAPVADLPCVVALEVSVHVPLGRHPLNWRLVTAEVERVWAPYGVTFCWADGPAGCRGVAVHLKVLVTGVIDPGADAADPREPAVGQIAFDRNGPGRLILLSLDAARQLVEGARIGDRSLRTWPEATVAELLPRVLGRALAHEIGHYLLGTRAHTRVGLMAGSFRPDEATLGSDARFRLAPDAGAAIRRQCSAGRLAARTGPTGDSGLRP